MAIVEIPHDLQISRHLICSICRVTLRLNNATAGLFDTNSRQAFACVSHFSEVGLLILGWADFMAAERKKYKRQQREAGAYGANNAWLNP